MSDHHNKRILVTGATGFLGSYLVRYLLHAGYRNIRALRRPDSQLDLLGEAAGQVEWVEGDVLDIGALEEALEGCQWVFHSAAIVSFDSRDAARMREINVEGTANVVNLCLYEGVEKLLHVSSVSALGRTKPGLTLSEASKWEKSPYNTNYGNSKFQAEQEVWRGIEEGLPAVIIQPAVVLGSGRWTEGPSAFFKTIYEGLRYYPPGGSAFVDVRDTVRMMVQLMASGLVRERFIASAGNWSYQELFRQIALALEKQPPSVQVNGLLRGLAWRAAWLKSRVSGQPSLITRETAMQSANNFFYDNQKSLQQLDFQYIPLETTIRETAQQFLEAVREPSLFSKVLPFSGSEDFLSIQTQHDQG